MPALEITTNGHTLYKKFACGKFSCRVCGPRLRLKFQAQVLQGMGDKECTFLTLTILPSMKMSVDDLNKSFGRWRKSIMRKLGRFEYVKVVELTKQGTPHLHLIVTKPQSWWQTERFSEWNPRKKRNDWWIAKDSWVLKKWQRSIRNYDVNRIAINPVRQDRLSASSELSKYVSKVKSKAQKGRWFSFSAEFRGCRPELKAVSSTYLPYRWYEWQSLGIKEYEEHDWEVCRHDKKSCSCERPVIVWDYRRRNNYEYDHVFINKELLVRLKEENDGFLSGTPIR